MLNHSIEEFIESRQENVGLLATRNVCRANKCSITAIRICTESWALRTMLVYVHERLENGQNWKLQFSLKIIDSWILLFLNPQNFFLVFISNILSVWWTVWNWLLMVPMWPFDLCTSWQNNFLGHLEISNLIWQWNLVVLSELLTC